jgi:glycosyltransferase involved in cell wall biosynthesis
VSLSEWLERKQPIPLWLILLVAAAIHGPLLMMRVPANSFDANFHMSMANHYAHHWFNPWNEQQLGGFSQTTYPPLTQQWVGLLSWIVGLTNAYMLVQFIAVLLLPIGIYHYAKLWVNERAASYASLASVFLGITGMLVYLAGQIGTTTATPLYMLAFPAIYRWMRDGQWPDGLKGMALLLCAASAHHATLLFGSVLFMLPILWLACIDRNEKKQQSSLRVIMRAVTFFSTGVILVVIVLLPYFLSLLKNPIKQMPIFHQSRSNFLLDPHWGMHYWVVPFGALLLALPFIFWKGTREKRLFPLFLGFYLTMIFGLGNTTPLPKLLLGRAFDILTFERFTYWACMMALPFVGLLAIRLVDQYRRKAVVFLATCAVATGSLGVAWNTYLTVIAPPINIEPILSFLSNDGHDKFRYMTLGFANQLSKVAAHTKANSIDGEYNSARSLPEIVEFGSAQLSSAKYFGAEGMSALRAVLKHADRYGLKYIFVRDQFYEPMLHFGGFRRIAVFNSGEISVWSKPFVPVAQPIPSEFKPPAWHGWLWGTLPFGTSILALMIAIASRKPVRSDEAIPQRPTPAFGYPAPAMALSATPPTDLQAAARDKICLVTAFPPGRGDLNEYGYHVARELAALPDVSLTVLADKNPAATRAETSGFDVRRCWRFDSLLNPIRLLGRAMQLQPNMVWFNMGFSTFAKKPVPAFVNLGTPLLLKLWGFRTHITLHTFMDNVNLQDAGIRFPALYSFAGNVATRLLLAGAEVTVLLPSYKRLLVEKYGANPDRVHVRPHGVISANATAPDFTRRETPTVLAFGNWGTYKRLEMLIESMREVVNAVPGTRLVVGGGDHPAARGYIAALKQRHTGTPWLTFLGYVPEGQVASVFGAANVVVMPYTSGAGASGVAHQACEFGVPIVAADLNDFREMSAHQEMAIDFFPVGDARALTEKLIVILRSPERQRQMALQNYNAALRMSMTHVVEDYVRSFGIKKQAGLSPQLATS